jgi:ribonucleoside-triphosphate reductase
MAKIQTYFRKYRKIGSSYFQNFIGSQYKLDENGQKVENENAYKPNAVRSMCCRLQLDLRELLNGATAFSVAQK